MTESYYYLVEFKAICEKCGESFEGVIAKQVPKNDSMLAGNIGNALADSADAAIRRKMVESAVSEKRWRDLDMSYGPLDHGCPHCGARQSWDPISKPEEPKKTAKGKAGNIGCFLLGAFFVGGVVGLIEYLVQSFVFYEDDPIVLLIIWAACLVAGLVLAIRSNKKDDEKAAGDYPDRVKEYERELAAYEAYQADVRSRSVHNDPIVDFSTAVFHDEKLRADELSKARPDCCPHCGKKLEGKVLLGSVQATRAANGKCPWCGEVLPSNRQVRIGTR